MNNPLKEKLKNGEAVIGTYIKSNDPAVTEVICMHDLDFVIIDNEHTAMSTESMVNLIRVCEIHGKVPMVRVRQNDASMVLQALDAGALGVQIPNLNTKEDAERAASYTKYAPEGIRGFASSQRCARYGLVDAEAYATEANESILTIVYCETREAVQNLDGILQVEGVDVVFIGPADLSQWFGKRGKPRDPEIQAVIAEIIDKTVKAGKISGTIAGSKEEAARLIEQGVRLVVVSSDLSMIHLAAKQLF